MKLLNYPQIRPPSGGFDNAVQELMLAWMHTFRLKAFRSFAAAAALFVSAGCDADGETVAVRTNDEAPAAAAEPQPNLLASAEPVAPVTTDTAIANTTTNTPAATETTTNATPVITQEIPPARPANLSISSATEKVIKLAEANLDEKVILTFVQQTPAKFDLDADEIVYLSDVGVSSGVIAAMLKHDGDDPAKAEVIASAKIEDVQPAIPDITNAAPPNPQQVVEVTTNYIPNQQVIVQQQPQTVVVEQPPQTVVYAQPETVSYFYDSLSPYGSWFFANDYGWCWQPTVAVVDRAWRPYGPRGHWAWTTSGWYWESDYTWGWAPFHYGRWQMAGARGWIWVPDRTWGPAWVTWRSSGDYCGWAPLPPAARFTPGVGFTYFGRGVDVGFGFGLGYDAFLFAPLTRFHSRRVYDYALPRQDVARVFPHSHVENHFEFRNDRREFVNRSLPQVEHGMRPAVVRDMGNNDVQRFGIREHIERTGRDTVIYRPPTPTATGGAPPARFEGRRENNATTTATPPQQRFTPGFGGGGIVQQENVTPRVPVVTRAAPVSAEARPAGAPTILPQQRDGRFGARPAESIPTPATPPPTAEPRREFPRFDPNGRGRLADAIVNTPAPTSPRVVGTPEIAPRTVAPAPQIVSPPPRIISPPPRTVTAPSVPTYNPPSRVNPVPNPAHPPVYNPPSRVAPLPTSPTPSTPSQSRGDSRGNQSSTPTSPYLRGRGRD